MLRVLIAESEDQGLAFVRRLADHADPSIAYVDDGEHFHLYLETDDPVATAAALKKNGVRFVKDLHDTPWGTREFAIKDDQGHTLYSARAVNTDERERRGEVASITLPAR